MAVVSRLLGKLRPANTTAASVYNKPAGARVKIESIVIANLDTSSHAFRLFWDYGTTYDQTTALFYDVIIASNTTLQMDSLGWAFDGGTGNLAFRTDSGNNLICWAWGEEAN